VDACFLAHPENTKPSRFASIINAFIARFADPPGRSPELVPCIPGKEAVSTQEASAENPISCSGMVSAPADPIRSGTIRLPS